MRKRIHFTALDGILTALLAAAGIFCAYRVSIDIRYDWQWPVLLQYLVRTEAEGITAGALTRGFITTVKLSLWATALATLLGICIGLLRISLGRFQRLIAASYVELVRNLPPLVLVFIVYFFIGDRIIDLLGLEETLLTFSPPLQETLAFFFAPPARLFGFFAGLATLVIYEAAYIAEIVRAGIQSIDRGQWEAAHALGLTRAQQLRFVILPQTFQRVLPSLAGQLISTIKDSAIVSVISIPELTFQGMEIMSATYLTFEIWITIMLLYFVLTFSLSLGIRRLERVRPG